MKKVIGFIFAIVVFTHCDDNPTQECSTLATVRDLTGLDGCGFVFELADGTRLEPIRFTRCGTGSNPNVVNDGAFPNVILVDGITHELVDGKKVFIGYDYEPTLGNSVSICMVGPVVRITCIQEAVSISEE